LRRFGHHGLEQALAGEPRAARLRQGRREVAGPDPAFRHGLTVEGSRHQHPGAGQPAQFVGRPLERGVGEAEEGIDRHEARQRPQRRDPFARLPDRRPQALRARIGPRDREGVFGEGEAHAAAPDWLELEGAAGQSRSTQRLAMVLRWKPLETSA
jgi:hypothetical protein